MKFHNKTILITGASGGFGQHFTRQLLEKENKLILTDLHLEPLTQTAEAIAQEVGRGEVVACLASDLSTERGAQELFEQVQAVGQPVDVLINNAGIALIGRHDEVPTAAWERLMQVNLLAPMRLCGLFVPPMIERQKGHIINISSLAGWTTDVGLSAYSASKFGLRGFSVGLYDELKQHNIQVSAVYPFYSRTPILDSTRYGSLSDRITRDPETAPGVTDPDDVVRTAIAQAEKGKLHVFTDAVGRLAYQLQKFPRFFDWAKQYLSAAA